MFWIWSNLRSDVIELELIPTDGYDEISDKIQNEQTQHNTTENDIHK